MENYKKGQLACYRCPVACTQKWEVNDGAFKAKSPDKLEFGHYTNMGPCWVCLIFHQLVHISDLVNRMGMDCVPFGWIWPWPWSAINGAFWAPRTRAASSLSGGMLSAF